jgi:hypothetical protein
MSPTFRLRAVASISHVFVTAGDSGVTHATYPSGKPMQLVAYMMSCEARRESRAQTLELLAATDWNEDVRVVLDESTAERPQERHQQTARRLLEQGVADDADVILFLEDDLEFNRHLRHNLHHWTPLRNLQRRGHFFGSLYNPSIHELEVNDAGGFFVADPHAVYGSQAFLVAIATARHMVEHWEELAEATDIKMSRMVIPLCPIYYHRPSLVQHRPVSSTWGGPYHSACDYQGNWRAETEAR